MTDIGLVDSSKGQVNRLIGTAGNPRDKAFVALFCRDGIRISEAIQLKESDVDFTKGTLSIIHLKERIKSKCPGCGAILDKRHIFCPGCGNRVDQAIHQKVEQRCQRTIPVDDDILFLIKKYLRWRRQFSYHWPLIFPFTRQRDWQLIERIGQCMGITGLHPHSLRHLLATTWVAKGSDVKKLQLLLGHASIATTMDYFDSNFEQLKFEYEKLWESNDAE